MSGFEREDKEIVRYYESIQAADIFGVWGTILLLTLPLSKAQRFMKPDHGWNEETWRRTMRKKDRESVIYDMEDYFQPAVEYVILHRGLAASRTLHHYMAWCWLLNDMELFAYFMDQRNYPNYGAPMLMAYAQKYGCTDLVPDNPVHADMFRKMAMGMKCSELCPGKCGTGSPRAFRPVGQIVAPATTPSLILPK